MANEKWQHLDERLRLRLAELDPARFEQFFLHFLRAGISLTVDRHGRAITRRVIKAELYAAGSGRNQNGIDLRAEVEGDGAKEIWVFQCKRQKTWNVSQTGKAIQKASEYQAHHYFLAVACDPHEEVQDEIHKYPNWTFWSLDTICAEVRLRVPPSKLAQVLFFLSPAELKRFAPFTTESLITPSSFFERFLGGDKAFRHDWNLVGRHGELQMLRDFLAGKQKVQILCAKGGEGKSRLLWELCQTLAIEDPTREVLCLNPHRGKDDEFPFPFVGDARRRVILVDDAHRTEDVPLPLLSLVRQDPDAKIIFATRPQGVEALAHKLIETSLAHDLAPQIALSRLKRSDLKALAEEALGAELAVHAMELARLTDNCPFLTVVAGDMLRRGRLEWGKWASDDEFRRRVFREFELRNFETIPEADREFAKGLLRLLALIAPATIDSKFPERAATILGCPVVALETQLHRLRRCELAVGGDDGLRIVPDLFADFLVYDTCYGPGKMPGFVHQVLGKFEGSGAALLRNLSEATWIVRANGVLDDTLINVVLEQERRQFEEASFYKRAEMLRHWSGFSMYLPAESLELARKAIKLDTAPVDPTQQVLMALGDCDHAYVCAEIPAMLQPVATYHALHRHAALGLLWNLGLTQSWTQPGSNENHPWATIAKVIHFEPKKSIEVTLDALNWLSRQVQNADTLQTLEGTTPILRALLGPCFERVVETSEWEGRTVHFRRQPVCIRNTQPIRDRALEILAWVIDHGSPAAALDAISALEIAVARVTRRDAVNVDHEARVRAEWLPERQKALRLYAAAAARHSNVAVRYAIRQTLHRRLKRQEDSAFTEECHRILGTIADDLELAVTRVILLQDPLEFDEATELHDGVDSYERSRERRKERIRETARLLAESHPNVDALREFLHRRAAELAEASHHVQMGPLFAELAQVSPSAATQLARQILEQRSESPLARAWPALTAENNELNTVQRLELLQLAARSATAALRVAVVESLSSRILRSQPITALEQSLLLEIAAAAGQEETIGLLGLVERSDGDVLPWAYSILEALPLRGLTPLMGRIVFRTLAPFRERPDHPPPEVVRSVLMRVVSISDLGELESWPGWTLLVSRHPRLAYEFLRDRIVASTADNVLEGYRAFPPGEELDLSALVGEPDYPALCDELWLQVAATSGRERYDWVRLFQAVVFLDSTRWPPRMANAIESATTAEDLARISHLLKFEGSRIVFRFPDITRAILKQALAIGGDQLFQEIRVDLYAGCGPQTRMFTNGILDQKLDYVEAEAWKAAEGHHADELLGPFYRWIVEVEQKERVLNKMQADAAIASLG